MATSQSEINRGIIDVGYKDKNTLLFNNSVSSIKDLPYLSIVKNWPDDYICSVGRPSYQKNIELMLDVLYEIKKQNNGIHLVLMGVGFHSPNLYSVKKKIEDLKLSNNITLLDWTSREDVFNIISKSRLYISTSRYEGLPYSLIETLALGKPIVATNCDGNRDLVKNNYNGFLIENENIHEFSKRIIEILDNYGLQKKMSLNSFEFFSNNFDLSKNIKKLESIYSKVSCF